MDKVIIETVDYKGRTYDRFHARKSSTDGPGWFVFGRNPEYGDTLVCLCARPDVQPRRHPHYNCQVRRGWPTKREAQAIAQKMNDEAERRDAQHQEWPEGKPAYKPEEPGFVEQWEN